MGVRVTHEDGIATVMLDRPEKLNAVNDALRSALTGALDTLAGQGETRAVILAGAGGRAFCAGQDLAESAALEAGDLGGWLDRQRAMYQAVRDLPVPCIAALEGVAAGAGLQLALCADFRIGHPGTRLGQPEVKAGLASIVGSYLLSLHVGMGTNARLSLAAEFIAGEEAKALGLLTHLVPEASAVMAEARHLAEALAALPRAAMRESKRRFRDLTQPGFDAANEAARAAQAACYASGAPQAVQRAFLAAKG